MFKAKPKAAAPSPPTDTASVAEPAPMSPRLTMTTRILAKVESEHFELSPNTWRDGDVHVWFKSPRNGYSVESMNLPVALIPELVKLLEEIARVTVGPDTVTVRELP